MPKTKCSWNHARSETSTRTGNVICQRPKVEEAIWAALQKLPVGQSSCHEDCHHVELVRARRPFVARSPLGSLGQLWRLPQPEWAVGGPMVMMPVHDTTRVRTP